MDKIHMHRVKRYYEYIKAVRSANTKNKSEGKDMRVITLLPNMEAETINIENKLETLQEFIGGYLEVIKTGIPNVIMIFDEEGLLKGLKPNRFGLVGPIIICGTDGEEFRSLTDEEYTKIINQL